MDDRITVLHVDDDPELADVVASMLESTRSGFEVLTEHSGEAALDRVADADVDCVVSDYDMTSMNGLELLSQVREAYPDLPFILYTGHGSEDIASDAISAGVTDYVQKQGGSEQYEMLAKRIENAVDRTRARAQAAQHAELTEAIRGELESRVDEVSQYERLVETMNDGAYMLDEEGIVVAVNDVLTLLTGYTREEMVDQHISSFVDEAAVDRSTEKVRSLLSEYGPSVEVFDAEFEDSRGETFPAEVSVSLLPYDEEFRGTINVVRDVSTREHVKARLREERHKIKRLHEVATAMEDCETPQDVYDVVVETAERVLDFDICTVSIREGEKLVTKAVSGHMPSDGHYDAIDTDHGLAGKTYQTGESYLVNDLAADDDAEPADESYSSVVSVPFGDRGVFQATSSRMETFDGSDRELAELLVSHAAKTVESLESRVALEDREERYRTVVEGSRDPMAICRGGEFAFVNRRAADVVGEDREALLGTSVFSVIHPDDHEAVEAALSGDVDDDTIEVRFATPHGPRYHEVTARQITYGGEPAVLCAARDITDRVETKRQLERQNERLEEFASVVSHDLRNPLTVAQAALAVARERPEDEHFARVSGALDRMEQLIGNLLALARQGEVVDETQMVRLSSVARQAWRSVETFDAEVTIADGPLVEADENRLLGLFENLFRNAVEHAGPDVHVDVGPTDDGFYVADDGPGIPPEERADVLEHGYTTNPGGTGFGLSIVQSVAEAHGWSVGVAESETGGARFEVSGVRAGA